MKRNVTGSNKSPLSCCLVEDRTRSGGKFIRYFKLLSRVPELGKVAVAAYASAAFNNPISRYTMQNAGLNESNSFVSIKSPSIYGEIPLPEYALIDALADLPSKISPDQDQKIDGELSPELLDELQTLFDSVLNEFIAK